MTPDAGWKRDERRVAQYLGTIRTPLSGGNSRHTRSDTLHPTLYIEVKTGASVPRTWPATVRLFEEVEKRAAAEGKTAVLVKHRRGVRSPPDWPACVRACACVGAGAGVRDGAGGGVQTCALAGAIVEVPLSVVRIGLLPAAPPNGGSVEAPP